MIMFSSKCTDSDNLCKINISAALLLLDLSILQVKSGSTELVPMIESPIWDNECILFFFFFTFCIWGLFPLLLACDVSFRRILKSSIKPSDTGC